MKMYNFAFLAVLVAMWGFTSPARAATLAGWLFSGAENGVDTVPANNGTSNSPGDPSNNPFIPSVVHANLSASGITAPFAGAGGSATVRIGALSSLGYSGAGNVFLSSSQGIGDTVDQYFTLTLTPDASYFLDLTDLRVQAARGGGSERGFRVRSSMDGFAADLNGPGTALMTDANGGSQRPNFTPYTIDLSAPAFNMITTPIEFRFYPWSTAPNNTIEMDNLVFNGEVFVIPEAASLTLLLAGLVCSCGTRLRLQR